MPLEREAAESYAKRAAGSIRSEESAVRSARPDADPDRPRAAGAVAGISSAVPIGIYTGVDVTARKVHTQEVA